MNNPMNFLKTIAGNPKNAVMKMIGNNANPMMNNLINMANQGDTKGIETFARNLFKEKGLNFDEEFSNFMNNFK